MIRIELTAEDIKNATSYIPLMEKTAIATYCGERCFIRTEISADNGAALPPMYREDKNKSSRYIMGILAAKYLKKSFTPVEGEEFLLSADEYDNFAGSHIVNQLERFKANAELRDKCFDILYDFRDVKRRIETEIFCNLQAMNDPVTRGAEALQSSVTPNAVKDLQKETDELTKMLEEYRKAQE